MNADNFLTIYKKKKDPVIPLKRLTVSLLLDIFRTPKQWSMIGLYYLA